MSGPRLPGCHGGNIRVEAPLPSAIEGTATDPLVDLIAAWFKQKDAADALSKEWQELEHELSLKRETLRLDLNQAARSGLPEARRMRLLMQRLRAADPKLDRAAQRILQMRAGSRQGALAKIEMALRIQAPINPQEPAWALIRAGFEELRQYIDR